MMKKLTYTDIRGIFERLFISPMIGVKPLNKEYIILFEKHKIEHILYVQDFAQKCKKLENSYNNSTNKFHWWLDNGEQYKNYRDTFVHVLSDYIPREEKNSLETSRASFQLKHSQALKKCEKKKPFRWICANEKTCVQGVELTRGLFYLGDYFKIPRSYKEIKDSGFRSSKYWNYNTNYKLSKLYGPVIREDLPISNEELKIVPFSCYLDMHPSHRYEYLEWLAGQKSISEISSETFLFYLFGLQLRMFIDDTTTEKDRLEIVNRSVDLYVRCREENVYCLELVDFIDAAISKFFVDRLEELVPKDILPHLRLCRDALILSHNNNIGSIMSNICRNMIVILNYDGCIPTHLITDSFFAKFADMVDSELTKMSYEGNWKELQNFIKNPESSYHYELYCINRPQDDSALLFDYIFNFRLYPNIYSLRFFNRCINNCFKRIVKRISEYNILASELPPQATRSLSLFDSDFQNIHKKIHRIITESEEFSTIEKETNAAEYSINKDATANKLQVSLNEERLTNIEKQTRLAHELLSDIFDNNEEVTDTTNQENSVLLDILKILLTKESWKRNEVEALCQKHNLITSSVMEKINDYSYSKIEDTVIEDDGDTIYVMTDYKDRLI